MSNHKNNIKTFGSLCSGIEAASFVLEPLDIKPLWLSEIADYQSKFLASRYPKVPNLGDMNDIPEKISKDEIDAPDFLCGGTPCQAFSLAGWRNGINDDRGQLTLKYIDILNGLDEKRKREGKPKTIFFWENVEGALTDKTNAFGCFLAGLLGLNEPLISPLGKIKNETDKEGNTITVYPKWSSAGIIKSPNRNIAWRVLDAKYFGLPQQRKRIYLLGGGSEFNPEQILFEKGDIIEDPYKVNRDKNSPSLFDNDKESVSFELTKEIEGHSIEAFRSYSDCLYAAYGTKWNGNAAAFNGSLYFAEDGRLRRLSPLECERLMGFPDNYTLIPGCRDTQRYQAVGNSWAVPVIQWIMDRLINPKRNNIPIEFESYSVGDGRLYLLKDFNHIRNGVYLNASSIPYNYKITNMVDIADVNTAEKFYITARGCAGILRRKNKHKAGMNKRLEIVLENCSQVNENN